MAADWATIAELGTAGGTLVLAVATFASVRSANRAARAAETSRLESIRPLVLSSRLGDPPEKVGFQDDHWIKVPGGQAVAEATDQAVYFAIAVRNAGNGLAVLNGWLFHPERFGGEAPHPEPAQFRRLTRDLYIPTGDLGFWQGTMRDPGDPVFTEATKRIEARQTFTVDLLYGDAEGGQRVITRFSVIPHQDGEWLAVVSRHWNLDRPDPRETGRL